MESFWLYRYAVLVAACTLLLVVAGASVTSKEAGLSVPDWPLSYGQVMPEMKGGVFFEHGHRMIASGVGFLTIVLAVWIWKADRRIWMRRLGYAALAGVIVQGLLGGLTVLFLLPKAVSIAHACLAQLFFSTTVAIAIFASPSWREDTEVFDDSGSPSLRAIALSAPVVVLVQLGLGAAYRHKAIGILPHILGAMLVMLVITFAAVTVLTQVNQSRTLRRFASALLAISGVQLFLGVAAYLARVSAPIAAAPSTGVVLVTVAHVAVGALTMAASVALAIQVFRHVRPRQVPLASRTPALP